jgi:proline racemase
MILDAPGGPVTVRAACRNGRCERVTVTNLPSFAFALDVPVEVRGLGTVTADLAYGGDTFAIVDAAPLGFALTRDEARDLVETGERIKQAAREQHPVVHPENQGIDHISFVEFTTPVVRNAEGHPEARNTVVISPGKLDRSPCGTGTSARLATLHARGAVGVGETFVSRSILDTRFDARIESTTRVGDHPAVIPSLSGRAWLTGIHQYGLDPDDPFPEGYTLSDTWYRAL